MKQEKILKQILFSALIGGAFLCANAWADTGSGTGIFQNAYNKMYTTFKNVRPIVYVLAGFGLIGISIGGIMGKIKWTWLASLAAALAILGMAEQIIDTATDESKGLDSPITITAEPGFDISGVDSNSMSYSDFAR